MCVPELSSGASEEADDAASCCGSPLAHLHLQPMMGFECWDDDQEPGAFPKPGDIEADSQAHQHTLAQRFLTSGPIIISPQQSNVHSDVEEGSWQQMGDDFEALDASILLEADMPDAYPGGVDAALADWQAAVSSHGHTAPAGITSPAEGQGTSSTSCAHNPRLQHGQLPLNQHAVLQQQQQQQQQQQRRQLVTLQVQYMCPWQQQQQQQQGHASLAQPRLAAVVPGGGAAPQARCCCVPPAGWAAFEGDVVGDVLSGKRPAPSCNSCDDWLPCGP